MPGAGWIRGSSELKGAIMESCRNCRNFGRPICNECTGVSHYRQTENMTRQTRKETYVTFMGNTYKAQVVAVDARADEFSTLEFNATLSPDNYVGAIRSTPQIKDVIFNPPATIVFWGDDTKTVVQAQDGEKFDPEKGLAMAISKKILGNKYDYYHTFAKYLKKWDKRRGVK